MEPQDALATVCNARLMASVFLSLGSWPRCHLFREAFRNHSYFLNTSLSRWPCCTVSRPHSILTICSDILVWLLAKHLAPSLGYEPHMGRNQTDLFIKVCAVPGTAWHMECEIKLCGMNKWNEWMNEWMNERHMEEPTWTKFCHHWKCRPCTFWALWDPDKLEPPSVPSALSHIAKFLLKILLAPPDASVAAEASQYHSPAAQAACPALTGLFQLLTQLSF